MALLKLSGIVTLISGKLGGSILGTNQNGSYIKQNSYSQQHATPLQSKRRTQIYVATTNWKNTTAAQKALWSGAVSDYSYINRVGDTVVYTGYQLFIFLNSNLSLIEQTQILTPPVYVAPVTPTLLFNELDATSIKLAWSGNTIEQYIVIYCSKPLDANILNAPKEMRFLKLVKAWFVNGVSFSTTEYLARFGPLTVGKRVFYQARFISPTKGITTGILPAISQVITAPP